MIEFSLKKGMLELKSHSDDATLGELLEASEAFVASLKKNTVSCKLCGECCRREPILGLDILALSAKENLTPQQWAERYLMPPELPDLAARTKGIAELRAQTALPEAEAAVLYEYNASEPLSFRQTDEERCFYQKGCLCGNYADRPFVCRLYLCRFGEKLQDLLEMVVTQGTWHAYHVLGAVPAEAIAHNPFLKAASYADVRLKGFEFGLEGAMEVLFSFF